MCELQTLVYNCGHHGSYPQVVCPTANIIGGPGCKYTKHRPEKPSNSLCEYCNAPQRRARITRELALKKEMQEESGVLGDDEKEGGEIKKRKGRSKKGVKKRPAVAVKTALEQADTKRKKEDKPSVVRKVYSREKRGHTNDQTEVNTKDHDVKKRIKREKSRNSRCMSCGGKGHGKDSSICPSS